MICGFFRYLCELLNCLLVCSIYIFYVYVLIYETSGIDVRHVPRWNEIQQGKRVVWGLNTGYFEVYYENPDNLLKDALEEIKRFKSSCLVLFYPHVSIEVRREVVNKFERMSYDHIQFSAKTSKEGYIKFAIDTINTRTCNDKLLDLIFE